MAMGGDPGEMMTGAARQMMSEMETKDFSFPPMQFVQLLRNVHPMYAERDDHGGFKQQDADEFLNCILNDFRGPMQRTSEDGEDLIGDLFGLELSTTHTNNEDPTEVTDNIENVMKLSCVIENGAKPADSLQQGLKLSFEGEIEKNSPKLGRDAIWTKVSKVNRLVSNNRHITILTLFTYLFSL